MAFAAAAAATSAAATSATAAATTIAAVAITFAASAAAGIASRRCAAAARQSWPSRCSGGGCRAAGRRVGGWSCSRRWYSSPPAALTALDVRRLTQPTLVALDCNEDDGPPAASTATACLTLRLITPQCELYRGDEAAARAACGGELPFWGFLWPGGYALARYLADAAAVAQGRAPSAGWRQAPIVSPPRAAPWSAAGNAVLDVGCGSGVCGLAAQRLHGAAPVLANDIDAGALVAAGVNWGDNGAPVCDLTLVPANLLHDPPATALAPYLPPTHPLNRLLVLVGDVAYDADIATAVLRWLRAASAAGATVLIGDPGRAAFAAAAAATLVPPSGAAYTLRELASYALPPRLSLENATFASASALQLVPA